MRPHHHRIKMAISFFPSLSSSYYQRHWNELKKIFIIIITIGIILIIWQTAVARKLGVNVLLVVKLAHTNCHFHHNQRKHHYDSDNHHHHQQLQNVTGLAAVSV